MGKTSRPTDRKIPIFAASGIASTAPLPVTLPFIIIDAKTAQAIQQLASQQLSDFDIFLIPPEAEPSPNSTPFLCLAPEKMTIGQPGVIGTLSPAKVHSLPQGALSLDIKIHTPARLRAFCVEPEHPLLIATLEVIDAMEQPPFHHPSSPQAHPSIDEERRSYGLETDDYSPLPPGLNDQDKALAEYLTSLSPHYQAEAKLETRAFSSPPPQPRHLQIEESFSQKLQAQKERQHRERYLLSKLRSIFDELESKEPWDESEEYRHYWETLEKGPFPLEVSHKLGQELSRLQQLSPYAHEAAMIKTYLDTVLSLPWGIRTANETNLNQVAAYLEAEHYGLSDVKERVLEFLAVQQLTEHPQSTILCLVGPPGVGKTSFAKSIANSLGRSFAYVPLGGIQDQAEVRGHRRTVAGAMPGRIIQAIQEAGTTNPVIVLDEIEKMGSSPYGDPEAAMLEILDPSRNHHFVDHYLDVPFDFSQVLFIATANTLYGMSRALRDRLEVIRISGYTDFEKQNIAQRFLLPKLLKTHGIKAKQLVVKDNIYPYLIDHYTREAGVRELERMLARICRKTAMAVVKNPKAAVKITQSKELQTYLGVERFTRDSSPDISMIGVVNGLAWTGDGGDILRIESNQMPGKGKLTLTGCIGNVMMESAQAALCYLRSHCQDLGIESDLIDQADFHIHMPEGATPKDGPSAGMALAISMISSLRDIAVKPKVAMTGEMTIRGRVLPIGGLKEKCLAAVRMKMTTILLPEGNLKEVEEIPEDLRKELTFIPVKHIEDAFEHVFEAPIKPLPHKGRKAVPARKTIQKAKASRR